MNRNLVDAADRGSVTPLGLSRRDFLRGSAAALAAAGASTLVFDVQGASAKPAEAAKPVKGGHVTEGFNTDISTFNGVLASDGFSMLVASLVNDSLLTYDKHGALVPMLATAVPSGGPDGNTYTFNIRDGVNWTDGTPLTSDDVLFTYNLIFSPQYSSVSTNGRGNFTKYVESITAPDPRTFVIKTKMTYAPLLTNYATYTILPKHVLGSIKPSDINTANYNSAPTVTCGMFKFNQWQKGAQVVLDRNENYWNGAPYLDQYVYKVLPSSVATGNAMQTGEVDIGAQLPPSLVAKLKSLSDIKIHLFSDQDDWCILNQLNPDKPGGKILQDVRVRQALSYAINRPGIVKSVLFGEGTVARSVEPPFIFGYDAKTKPQYSYSPKKANQILEKAGWKMDADGVRSKNGTRLALTMLTETGNPTLTDAMQVIQQNWKAVGCSMTPTVVEFPVLVTTITQTRDFDTVLIGIGAGTDPDQSTLYSSAAAAPGGINGMDFKNAKVDALLADGVSTLNKSKRTAIYAKYQDAMAELLPVTPLWYGRWAYGVLDRVRGTQFNAYQWVQRPWMNKVWVTNGK